MKRRDEPIPSTRWRALKCTRLTSMPSNSAWIRAGVTATAGSHDRLHDDTAAKVPDSSRFWHSQKPPSSQTSAFSMRLVRLRKMKQSPV
jgi:hypothetical protein